MLTVLLLLLAGPGRQASAEAARGPEIPPAAAIGEKSTALAPQVAAAPPFTLTVVYNGPVDRASINDRSQIVGAYGMRSFAWDRNKQNTTSWSMWTINHAGYIVGETHGGNYFWAVQHSLDKLGTEGELETIVPPPSRFVEPYCLCDSIATDVNDWDQVVGTHWAFMREGVWKRHPFLWQNGVVQDLWHDEAIDGGWARGINELGHVAGQVRNADGFRAFYWDGQPHILPLPAGATWTNANDINDHDRIVGMAADSSGNSWPVMWDKVQNASSLTFQVTDLRDPDAGTVLVRAVNNYGQIVGDKGIWQGKKWISLSSLLPPGAGAGWLTPYDITDTGQIVAGRTKPDGSQDTVLLEFGDSDGDGLPDLWEAAGVTIDPDGSGQPLPLQFIDLPAMGADRKRADIFLQIDWMQGTHNQKLTPAAIKKVVQAFAASPYVAANGSTGINLHVDEGPTSILDFNTNSTWGTLSRARALPEQIDLGTGMADTYDWSAFDQIKQQTGGFKQSGRESIFRYAVAAHFAAYIVDATGIAPTNGISRGVCALCAICGSDLIISLGGFTRGVGSDNEQAGTLMHELGHNLGLDHGGGDSLDYKPNYLSVMNDVFQLSGLYRGGTGGVFDYSGQLLDPLLETSLHEQAGLGSAAAGYGTRHECDGRGLVVTNASGPIDWNCDGDTQDDYASYDINGNGDRFDLLPGFNDWANLNLKSGAIGQPPAAYSPPRYTAPDPFTASMQRDIEPWPSATPSPVTSPSPTRTATVATATSTRTSTPVPSTSTPSATGTLEPTDTNTAVPPSSTPTTNSQPPTNTRTVTRTSAVLSPTSTRTAIPYTSTKTRTPVPPTSTRTATKTSTLLPTHTNSATRTKTPLPPTHTGTATNTRTVVTATYTKTSTPAPTSTATIVAKKILCVAVSAMTTTAPCSNGTTYTSIQAAVNTASAGDEIRVADGEYSGAGAAVVTLSKSLTVVGGYSASDWAIAPTSSLLTRISGSASQPGVKVSSGVSATIQSLQVYGAGVRATGATVRVSMYTLDVLGGTSSGDFEVASGAALRFYGDQQTLVSATVAGAGSVEALSGYLTIGSSVKLSNLLVDGGLVTVATSSNVANWSLENGALTVNGPLISATGQLNNGTLDGTNVFTVTGVFTWTQGTMAGKGKTSIASGAKLNISGTGDKALDSRQLNNAGTIVWSGSGVIALFSSLTSPVINNSGLFEIRNDSALDASPVYIGSGAFNNSGTLRKTANSGTTMLRGTLTFKNTGVVEVQSGMLQLYNSGPSSSSGGFTVAAGAVVDFGASYNLSGNGFNSAGTTRISGGDVVVKDTINSARWEIAGGYLTVNGSSSSGAWTLLSGALQGSGIVTVTGVLTWTGGMMVGPGKTYITPGARLNISGSEEKQLDGRQLNNAGTVAWSGSGAITLFSSSASPVINNSGLFEVRNDSPLDAFSVYIGSGAFNNSGTFRKTASSGTTSLRGALSFSSTGVVEVQSGTLQLYNSNNTSANSSSGSFSVAAGATVDFGASYNLSGFNSAGTTRISGGEVVVNSILSSPKLDIVGGYLTVNGSSSGSAWTLASGALQGSGTVTVTGVLTWTGGMMAGTGKTHIAPGARLNISGTDDKVLDSRQINNAGTATWTGSGLISVYSYSARSVINNSGLFEVRSDSQLNAEYAYDGSTFNNSGTFRKTASNGTTSLRGVLTFSNTGTVEVQSGTLQLYNSTNIIANSSSGSFSVAAGAAVDFGASYNLNGFTSAGTTRISGGEVVVNSILSSPKLDIVGGYLTVNGSSSGSAWTLASGALQGRGTVTVTGVLTWTGGMMAGTGKTNIAPGAKLNISGTDDKVLDSRQINNVGTATWSGSGSIYVYSNSARPIINNGGLFEVRNNVQLNADYAYDGSTFNNSGTFRKIVGTAKTNISMSFLNSGVLEALSGTLGFSNSFDQTAGSTNLLGGSVSTAQQFTIQGGSLVGAGTFVGSIQNGGIISPGDITGTAILNISGSLTQSPGARIKLEIGGTTAGTQYDKLIVTGAVTLDGTLDASLAGGYAPPLNTAFRVLTWGSRTGGFTSVNAPGFSITYATIGADLVAGTALRSRSGR